MNRSVPTEPSQRARFRVLGLGIRKRAIYQPQKMSIHYYGYYHRCKPVSFAICRVLYSHHSLDTSLLSALAYIIKKNKYLIKSGKDVGR